MAQQSTVSAWSECLFVYLFGPRTQTTRIGIGSPRETDKTHDQLQAEAGSQVPNVVSFGPTLSGEIISTPLNPLVRCPSPLNPSPQACAQLLSLIIKSNKLFSIDLHAGSSAVQKRTPAHPKKKKKWEKT